MFCVTVQRYKSPIAFFTQVIEYILVKFFYMCIKMTSCFQIYFLQRGQIVVFSSSVSVNSFSPSNRPSFFFLIVGSSGLLVLPFSSCPLLSSSLPPPDLRLSPPPLLSPVLPPTYGNGMCCASPDSVSSMLPPSS